MTDPKPPTPPVPSFASRVTRRTAALLPKHQPAAQVAEPKPAPGPSALVTAAKGGGLATVTAAPPAPGGGAPRPSGAFRMIGAFAPRLRLVPPPSANRDTPTEPPPAPAEAAPPAEPVHPAAEAPTNTRKRRI